MQPDKEIHEITLTGMSYGGDAIGNLPDGRVVFVPFALPGERVRLQITEEKRSFARGRLLEVLTASPDRIEPRCRHFIECGGCHYQHLPYEKQLEVKQTILREQFQRIAGIADPSIEKMVPSPAAWNYRNTVQFHLSPNGKLGYQAAGSHRIVEISECHLPEERLNQLWPQLELEPLSGLERVELRQGAGDDAMLVLESRQIETPDMDIELPISVVHLSPAGSLVLAGDDHVVMQVKDRAFQVSAGSFFQVNTAQAAAMVDELLVNLPLSDSDTFLDVYCGVGLFSAFLAPKVKQCVGIELSESACDDYAANLDEFDNVALYVGAAETILPALQLTARVAIVDPPRAGLARPALDALVQIGPEVIAYVSCDPSTLSRDARLLLEAGYRLTRCVPFDLFPQTYHIESVSFFSK
jgi:23S rRNA (uracil1939-C5)-methyltransferase